MHKCAAQEAVQESTPEDTQPDVGEEAASEAESSESLQTPEPSESNQGPGHLAHLSIEELEKELAARKQKPTEGRKVFARHFNCRLLLSVNRVGQGVNKDNLY